MQIEGGGSSFYEVSITSRLNLMTSNDVHYLIDVHSLVSKRLNPFLEFNPADQDFSPDTIGGQGVRRVLDVFSKGGN